MSVTVHPPSQAAAEGQPAPAAAPASASTDLIRASNAIRYCVDARGRKIGWRRLSALEDFDLVEMAGASASNEEWMLRATIAFGVRELDGEPCARPMNRRELRAMVARLDSDGMTAILSMFGPPPEAAEGEDPEKDRAKNSAGTPA